MVKQVGTTNDVAFMATFLLFAVALLLEAILPFRRQEAAPGWRWFNNFSLSLLTWYLTNFLGTVFLIWLTNRPWVALPALLSEVHPAIGFIVLLLTLSFLGYWIHRIFHTVSWLWPIHAVHHSDTEVDASTTFRHHPLEPLFSLPIVAPVVLMLGTPAMAVLIYRVWETALQIWNHTNMELPESIEKIANKLVVTPGFHRVHHSADLKYTNSNYGNVLPLFDYVFGTARVLTRDEQQQLTLGLEYDREKVDSRVDKLLNAPVRKWLRLLTAVRLRKWPASQ